jgi:hypothetical protein
MLKDSNYFVISIGDVAACRTCVCIRCVPYKEVGREPVYLPPCKEHNVYTHARHAATSPMDITKQLPSFNI